MNTKNLTDRQKLALTLKGDHSIYFENPEGDAVKNGWTEEEAEENFHLTRIVCDADEVDVQTRKPKWPSYLDGRAYIPDWTPDWLYDILELWDAGESMESYFEFESEADIEEFKAICDDVNE